MCVDKLPTAVRLLTATSRKTPKGGILIIKVCPFWKTERPITILANLPKKDGESIYSSIPATSRHHLHMFHEIPKEHICL